MNKPEKRGTPAQGNEIRKFSTKAEEERERAKAKALALRCLCSCSDKRNLYLQSCAFAMCLGAVVILLLLCIDLLL